MPHAMNDMTVSAELLRAWVDGRSVARSLPASVPDRGGWRVETGRPEEIRRWVFAELTPELVELGRAIEAPAHVLKLCAAPEQLRAVLPARWTVEPATYFMAAPAIWSERSLPDGYEMDVQQDGGAHHVRVIAPDGSVAASGYGGEVPGAFVYDRIGTAPAHRRKGLGSAVMLALRALRQDRSAAELLVATAEGQALYASLGWRTLSPYATAYIPA
jgi:GNAT superfamily N-acetyltransferase